MSLLMDALKKAEQEKKEAAKKRDLLEESAFHLQTDEAEITGPNELPQTESAGLDTPVSGDVDENKSPLDLSLEPLDPEAVQIVDDIPEDPEYTPKIEFEENQEPAASVQEDDLGEITIDLNVVKLEAGFERRGLNARAILVANSLNPHRCRLMLVGNDHIGIAGLNHGFEIARIQRVQPFHYDCFDVVFITHVSISLVCVCLR